VRGKKILTRRAKKEREGGDGLDKDQKVGSRRGDTWRAKRSNRFIKKEAGDRKSTPPCRKEGEGKKVAVQTVGNQKNREK